MRWRRRLLALGSGDPSRAICSTLIAQAFQSLNYPVLPEVVIRSPSTDPHCHDCNRELLHIRHHSLYTPRDFDLSPYFDVVKPNLLAGFDFHAVPWDAESLTTAEMDAVFDLPYARSPHPVYADAQGRHDGDTKIPAWEMIRCLAETETISSSAAKGT